MVFELPAGAVELPLELPEPMLPLLVPPLAAPEPDLLKCASHSARETWPSLLVSTDEKLGVEALLLLDEPPEAALPDAFPDEPVPDEPVLLEPPEAALPDEDLSDEPDMPDEPELLLPEAAGEDEDLSLLLDEELWATATPDSANRAAAVATVRAFNFTERSSIGRGGQKSCPVSNASHMPSV